ncbi:MAG TPA: CHAD domain-containing protein [Steroidobacteraceae bacterium]|nr:CHAD domain-containing protein [Steroidobacteraceae bacterium]
MSRRSRKPTHTHPPAPPAARANGAGNGRGGEAREVEWQLTAPDLGAVRRWLERHSLLDHVRIEPLPAQQLHDTYLDTEDWRVFRAGFALRLRDKDGHVEATLKGLRSAREDVADRREITEPLSTGTAKALIRATGPVGSRVRDVAGIKPLRTLFDVRTSRQRFAVRSGNGAAILGEIALDEARFSRGQHHRRPLVLTRVELEAAGPDSVPLEQLVQRLRTECELHPARENKFAVGLRSASLEPPRTARPDRDADQVGTVIEISTRAGDFAAASLQRLLQEWQANEPAARLGEGPEPLHKLRVTGRRMDTILTLFRACLPAGLRRSRPTLKHLLDALGAVRDVDIRVEAVNAFRSGLSEGDRPALEPLLQHLASERARARSAMLRALDAEPTRRWLDSLADLVAKATPSGPSQSPRDEPALTVVPALIRKRFRKLRKCARRLTRESSMDEFHEVRIRTKKLRYALELVAPTYGKPAKEMLAALRDFQSRLGTQHDADVTARYLARLAARPPVNFAAAALFLMGRMAERRAREATRIGGKVEKPWRRAHGKRWKALRTRMHELYDDAFESNSKAGGRDWGAGRQAHGNGKPTAAQGSPAFRHVNGIRAWNSSSFGTP